MLCSGRLTGGGQSEVQAGALGRGFGAVVEGPMERGAGVVSPATQTLLKVTHTTHGWRGGANSWRERVGEGRRKTETERDRERERERETAIIKHSTITYTTVQKFGVT